MGSQRLKKCQARSARTLSFTGQHAGGAIEASAGTKPIGDLLNTAWQQFWKDPADYYAWEKKTQADLENKLLTG